MQGTDAKTLQGIVNDNTKDGTTVYSDDLQAYNGLPKHESVKHSVGEYVRGQVLINGAESFWSVLKRAYHGVFHHISKKYLDRYIKQFAGKRNIWPLDTRAQMHHIVAEMVGGRLLYRNSVA